MLPDVFEPVPCCSKTISDQSDHGMNDRMHSRMISPSLSPAKRQTIWHGGFGLLRAAKAALTWGLCSGMLCVISGCAKPSQGLGGGAAATVHVSLLLDGEREGAAPDAAATETGARPSTPVVYFDDLKIHAGPPAAEADPEAADDSQE
jgi:hypothetical protein